MLQIVHETLRQRARGGAASGSTAASGAPGSGGGGGGGPSPAAGCVLSTEDRDLCCAISADGLVAQSRAEKNWGGVRASVGVFASCGGKVYYEVGHARNVGVVGGRLRGHRARCVVWMWRWALD